MRRSRLTIFLVSTYLITWTSWWLLVSLADRGIITYGQARHSIKNTVQVRAWARKTSLIALIPVLLPEEMACPA